MCHIYYGEDSPSLLLPAYAGTLTLLPSLWELHLSAPHDLCPGNAPEYIVDVSKLCIMPSYNSIPESSRDGKESWDYFPIGNLKKHSFLAAMSADALRQRIVETLVSMLRQIPLKPKDSRLGLNETGLIKHLCWDTEE